MEPPERRPRCSMDPEAPVEHPAGSEARMSGPVVKRRTRGADPEAVALSSSTDALNKKLRSAEEALVNLALGVEGAVLLESAWDEDQNIHEQSFLALRKVGAAWRLHIEDVINGDLTATREITSVSRDLRIKAAHHVSELLEKLRAELREQRKRVEDANVALDTFLSGEEDLSLIHI